LKASPSSGTDWLGAGQVIGSNTAIYGWIVLLVVAPNLFLVVNTFYTASGGAIRAEFTLDNYGRLFERQTYPLLLIKTLLMGAGAASLATLVAVPLAYFTSRRVRAKSAVVLLFIVPLWISLLMRVFAWRIILGENGILNSLLQGLNLTVEPISWFIYNEYVAMFVMANVVLPYVFVAAFVAIDRVPTELSNASVDAGASPLATFRRITWPLARPGVFVGAALAFLIAVGDYVTPAMVGGLDGTTIGMLISSQFGVAGNWPFGAAIAMLLILSVSALLGMGFALTRTRGTFEPQISQDAREAEHPATLGEHLREWISRGGFAFVLLLLYLPLLVMAIFSFNDSTGQSFPFSGFTLRWYQEAANNPALLAALTRSALVSGLTVAIGTVVGTAFALALARNLVFSSTLAQSLFSLPVALPGIILGISFAIAFRFLDVGSSLFKVVVGHLTFVTPVVTLMVLNRLRTMDCNLEYAALDLGSSQAQLLRHITLPLIRPAIIAGAILGFTLSFDEVLVTLFLSASDPTLPIYIWNQLRFGFTPEINAVFTLIAGVSITAIVIAFSRLNRGAVAGTLTGQGDAG
jgi:spermidine/putrescine transport system permease protein